jgi:hypothetical protein
MKQVIFIIDIFDLSATKIKSDFDFRQYLKREDAAFLCM